MATAERTEIGRINTLIAEKQTLTTPLLYRIDTFARRLAAHWLDGFVQGAAGLCKQRRAMLSRIAPRSVPHVPQPADPTPPRQVST